MTWQPIETAPISAMLERVEAASGPVSDGEWRTLYRAAIGSPDSITFQHFLAAIEGSLDHAVAFTEAALPGWGWCVAGGPVPSTAPYAYLTAPDDVDNSRPGEMAPTPALALVIATLRALRDGVAASCLPRLSRHDSIHRRAGGGMTRTGDGER